MKTTGTVFRACGTLVGGMAVGAGISDQRTYLVAVGLAFVANAVRPSSTFKTKVPVEKLEQRSVRLERETGLVFDNFGTSCKLWPGYWEWCKEASPRLYASKVRPEGCKDNYWLNPEEYVGLEAVDYFENEVPKLLKEAEKKRLKAVEEREAARKASLERLRQRKLEDQAALADAGFAPDYYDQVDSDCQHELMNNPAGDPDSSFCYKCGSTFSGTTRSVTDAYAASDQVARTAAAARRAASGKERSKISNELELLLKILSAQDGLPESTKKKLVQRCEELIEQLDGEDPVTSESVSAGELYSTGEYQAAALRVFEEKLGRPSGPREIEIFMRTTEYKVAKLHDESKALGEGLAQRIANGLEIAKGLELIPKPEAQACTHSFNRKHRWVQGVCECCGLSQQ